MTPIPIQAVIGCLCIATALTGYRIIAAAGAAQDRLIAQTTIAVAGIIATVIMLAILSTVIFRLRVAPILVSMASAWRGAEAFTTPTRYHSPH